MVSKLLILSQRNTMVIKATTKIMIKVTVTPTKAEVSTQSDEFAESPLSKFITTSSRFEVLDEEISSEISSAGVIWMSLGAKTCKKTDNFSQILYWKIWNNFEKIEKNWKILKCIGKNWKKLSILDNRLSKLALESSHSIELGRKLRPNYATYLDDSLCGLNFSHFRSISLDNS